MVVPEVVASGSSGSVEGELLQECEYQEEMIGKKWVASLEYVLFLWPWVGHLVSMNLSFLIFEVK